MTPKIILIHGLNNNLECFFPLRDEFKKAGLDCELLTLPGHGEDRHEAKDLKRAFSAFDQRLRQMVQDPYVVIAFSQGALYLQLWLEKNYHPKPKSQVLLAPALFIKRQTKLAQVLSFIPAFLSILSRTPKPLRRYPSLYIWEYRTLFEGVKMYQAKKLPFKIPTLVMIDPKDELLDVDLLKDETSTRNGQSVEFHLVERKNLKGGMGKHHVLFHPNYFSPEDWRAFMGKILHFIT